MNDEKLLECAENLRAAVIDRDAKQGTYNLTLATLDAIHIELEFAEGRVRELRGRLVALATGSESI